MRGLLLAVLAAMASCVATVGPVPVEPIDCWSQVRPHHFCEDRFIWVEGHWWIDSWGRYHWVTGSYRLRIRDHRR